MRNAHTIGVALPIPEPYGSELQSHRESFGDTLAASIPTHITLLPPTPVPADDLDLVEEHLRKVAEGERSFEIHLRGTGTFHPVSPVVFVSVAMGISDCERVEEGVRSGPLARELSFPYHPHVTIAHHRPEEILDRAFNELAGFECEFEVREFHLYAFDNGAGWVPRRAFRLVG